MRVLLVATAACLALPMVPAAALTTAATATTTAASAPRHGARAPVPSANFLVEWRVQPRRAAAPTAGGWVVGSNDASTGATGFGPGAVVVGTAKPAAPQGVRVANGKEASLLFDEAHTRLAYDLTWSAQSESSAAGSSASGAESSSQSRARSQGAQGHEVTVHRVQGLRVTPHWSHGDSLALDLQLTRQAPVDAVEDAGARTARGVDFRSTVQVSFDEWQTVATVGDDDAELQVRVSWR